MANPTALILLLLAAAAMASASAYTTVVTTRVREESCERQMMPMDQCMMYVRRQMMGPYADGEAFLRSAVAARRRPMREEEDEQLQACCDQMQQMSSMCRCEAVMDMMSEMPQLQMKRMACNLPSMCGMSPCSCPRV